MDFNSKIAKVWPKVVLLGDSLTQFSFDEDGNWGGKLNSMLKRKADVLNRGFSGYTTDSLKLVLPEVFSDEFSKDIACLTLCIGANDSWFPTEYNFNPGITVERYQKNLIKIIEFLLKKGLTKDKILLITPPTIVVDQWVKYCLESKDFLIEKTPEHTKKYVVAMLEVGKEMGIKVFDSFELTSKEEHLKQAFKDGLHFSSYGANLIYELIKDDVEGLVKKFRKSDLENFPTYDKINYNEIKESF